MFCENCGRDNGNDYTVCPGCGKPKPGLFGEKHDFYSISGDSGSGAQFTSIDMAAQLGRSDASSALSSTNSALDELRKSSEEQLKTSEIADRTKSSYESYEIDDIDTPLHSSGTAGASMYPTMTETPLPRAESAKFEPVALPPQLQEMQPEVPKREDRNYDYASPPHNPNEQYMQEQLRQQQRNVSAANNDAKYIVIFLFVGLMFPIAGFILFAVNRGEKPEAAKFALIGGIIGMVFGSCCCGFMGNSVES